MDSKNLPAGLAYRPLRADERPPWDKQRVRLDQCTSFTLTLTLRDTLTGEERTVVDDWIPFAKGDEESAIGSITFQWTENNYSCDCNRSRYWQRAAGVAEADLDLGQAPCSARNPRYRIVAPDWLADIDEEKNR